jgi:hypothetical protein
MENGNGISRDIHFIANSISPFEKKRVKRSGKIHLGPWLRKRRV